MLKNTVSKDFCVYSAKNSYFEGGLPKTQHAAPGANAKQPPLKLKEVWAIRIRLQIANRTRDLALFNLAIDSKLRSCDLLKLKVRDVFHGSTAANRAMVLQQKTQQPVQFEITEQTRASITAWVAAVNLSQDDYLFKSRLKNSPHLCIFRRGNMRAYWISGFHQSDLIPLPMEPTPCDARKQL
jgi:integrase